MALEYAKEFYSSQTWKKCRRAFLSAHPLCERCSAKGIAEPAKIVHHRKYITPANIDDFDITLNWWNLEALCAECHNREHKGEPERYEFDADGDVIPTR